MTELDRQSGELPNQQVVVRNRVMGKIVFGCLCFYLVTLGATQTVYGGQFMRLRWVALAILTGVCGANYLSRLPKLRVFHQDATTHLAIFTYAIATAVTVVSAQNFTFSGLRWLSHIVLVITCLLFLGETCSLKEARNFRLFVKALLLGLVVVSHFYPAPDTPYRDQTLLRGAMGDANSFGHVCALCALLMFHGALSDEIKWARVLQGVLGCVCVFLLYRSGARSSTAALLAGGIMLARFYRLWERPHLIMAAALLIAVAFIEPQFRSRSSEFILKPNQSGADSLPSTGVFASRSALWSGSWEAFKQRPLLGWGFGADAETPTDWAVTAAAIGMIKDVTNDVCVMLEGSGIVGLGAYVMLLSFIFRRYPPSVSNAAIQSASRLGTRLPRDLMLRLHEQRAAYSLWCSLLVLFLFDGSAFSSGSLITALFWLNAGMVRALSVGRPVGKPAPRSSLKSRHAGAARAWSASGLVGGNEAESTRTSAKL